MQEYVPDTTLLGSSQTILFGRVQELSKPVSVDMIVGVVVSTEKLMLEVASLFQIAIAASASILPLGVPVRFDCPTSCSLQTPVVVKGLCRVWVPSMVKKRKPSTEDAFSR